MTKIFCVNDHITCCQQSEKALVKAKWILTICDKNISTEFCIISLLANEEKQDSKFLIKKAERDLPFCFIYLSCFTFWINKKKRKIKDMKYLNEMSATRRNDHIYNFRPCVIFDLVLC